jgi:MoaA/NifB/PqqE/SkfB family radical SAM enzyme
MDRKALLRRVVIETTRRCNLKCIHCKVSPENNGGNYQAIEMPLEVFERLVPIYRDSRDISSLSDITRVPQWT